MPDLRRLVAVPLLATSSLQALLVLTQTLTDRPIGLSLIEPGAELETIDGLLRSQGTLNHVYETAALSLLAVGVAFITVPDNSRWRTAWIVAAALAGSTVGLTHSRAAVLSVLLMIPFIALTVRMHDRGALQVGGAFLIGLTIAAAFTSSAWALRGDQSTSGDLDDISLGRITLATQALEMAVDHPLVGVGPGLYMETLEQRYETDQRYPFMVHNVSLAVAAENGIPAAILASFFCGWAMLRAIRSGPTGALLALSLVGFLLFDVLHYDRPVGLLMTAIWLGVLQNVDGQVTSRRVRSS
jgi:O-antigen ligase